MNYLKSIFKINHNEISIKTMRIVHQQETAKRKKEHKQAKVFPRIFVFPFYVLETRTGDDEGTEKSKIA